MLRTSTVALGRASAALVFSASVAWAQVVPKVEAGRHASPSGSVVLEMRPTSEDGGGPAHYELRRDGNVLWNGDRPFTLAEVVVTDDGIVCGYSHSNGVLAAGEFRFVIIDAKGESVIEEKRERTTSPTSVVMPTPYGNGMLYDAVRGWLIFRVVEADGEWWWIYELEPLKLQRKFACKDTFGRVSYCTLLHEVRPLAGAPLVVLQSTPCITRGPTTALSIVGYDAEFVWKTEIAHDVDGDKGSRYTSRPMKLASVHPFGQKPTFVVHLDPENVDVTFTVTRGQDGQWSVAETKRAPHERPH